MNLNDTQKYIEGKARDILEEVGNNSLVTIVVQNESQKVFMTSNVLPTELPRYLEALTNHLRVFINERN